MSSSCCISPSCSFFVLEACNDLRFFFSFLFVAAVAVAVAAVVVAAVVVVVDDDKAVSSSEPLRLDGDDFFRTDFCLEVISFGSEQIIK